MGLSKLYLIRWVIISTIFGMTQIEKRISVKLKELSSLSHHNCGGKKKIRMRCQKANEVSQWCPFIASSRQRGIRHTIFNRLHQSVSQRVVLARFCTHTQTRTQKHTHTHTLTRSHSESYTQRGTMRRREAIEAAPRLKCSQLEWGAQVNFDGVKDTTSNWQCCYRCCHF